MHPPDGHTVIKLHRWHLVSTCLDLENRLTWQRSTIGANSFFGSLLSFSSPCLRIWLSFLIVTNRPPCSFVSVPGNTNIIKISLVISAQDKANIYIATTLYVFENSSSALSVCLVTVRILGIRLPVIELRAFGVLGQMTVFMISAWRDI